MIEMMQEIYFRRQVTEWSQTYTHDDGDTVLDILAMTPYPDLRIDFPILGCHHIAGWGHMWQRIVRRMCNGVNCNILTTCTCCGMGLSTLEEIESHRMCHFGGHRNI